MLLTPCGGAVNDPRCVVLRGEGVWQSATGSRCRIDVSVECGIAAKFVADASLRIEHEDWQAKFVANDLHDWREV